jgi:hypothetical protein
VYVLIELLIELWFMRGGTPNQPGVIFECYLFRGQGVPLRLLNGYHGKLQIDGYASYHARVYFDEVLKAATPAKKKYNKATVKFPSKDLVFLVTSINCMLSNVKSKSSVRQKNINFDRYAVRHYWKT